MILQVFFPKYFKFIPQIFGVDPGSTPATCTKSEESCLRPGNPALIRFHIHQNDVRPHPADALPGDAEIVLSAEQPQKPAGAGDDDGADVPLRNLHLHVGNEAQPAAVVDADHFLALQLCKSNTHTASLPGFGTGYAAAAGFIPGEFAG